MPPVTHGLLQADGQVDHGHVGGGDAEGHAGDLAGAQTSDTGFNTPNPTDCVSTVRCPRTYLKTLHSQT